MTPEERKQFIDEFLGIKAVPATPGETIRIPKDFTAEKDIYARVYGASYAEKHIASVADMHGRAAVQDMLKFFNELQEKQ